MNTKLFLVGLLVLVLMQTAFADLIPPFKVSVPVLLEEAATTQPSASSQPASPENGTPSALPASSAAITNPQNPFAFLDPVLQPFQDSWQSVQSLFRAPTVSPPSETVQPIAVFFPEGGIDPFTNQLTVKVQLPQSFSMPKLKDYAVFVNINNQQGIPFPVRENPFERTVTIPNPVPTKSVPIEVEVLDTHDKLIAKTPNPVMAGWQATNFEHSFIALPDNFGELFEEEQQTVFVDETQPITELPASARFFKTSFEIPINRGLRDFNMEAVAISGRVLATGTVLSFNTTAQPPFGSVLLYSQSDFGSIRLTQGLDGVARISGNLLFVVVNPDDELSSLPKKIIPVAGLAAEKPIPVVYELGLYPLDVETSQKEEPLVFYQNKFELPRAVPENQAEPTNTAMIELEDESGKAIEQLVPEETPAQMPAQACITENESNDFFTIPPWPDVSEPVVITAEKQVISEPVPVPSGETCYPIDFEKLQSIAQQAWAKGKKLVTMALETRPSQGTAAVLLQEKLPLVELPPKQPLSIRSLFNGKQTRLIDHPQEFSLEISNIRPNKRLFVIASPNSNGFAPKNCVSLLAGLIAALGSEETAFSEALAGAQSIDSLSAENRTKLSNVFSSFSENDSGKDWPVLSMHASFEGTDDSLLNSLPPGNGPYQLFSIDGSEFQSDQNLLVTVSPNAPADWNGKQVSFTACQFGTNELDLVQRVESSPSLVVQLGSRSCENLSECLLIVDGKVVQDLFPGSEPVLLGESNVKLEAQWMKGFLTVCLTAWENRSELKNWGEKFWVWFEGADHVTTLVRELRKDVFDSAQCVLSDTASYWSEAGSKGTAFVTGLFKGKTATVAKTIVLPEPAASQPDGSEPAASEDETVEGIKEFAIPIDDPEFLKNPNIYVGFVVKFSGTVHSVQVTDTDHYFLLGVDSLPLALDYEKRQEIGLFLNENAWQQYGNLFQENQRVNVWTMLLGPEQGNTFGREAAETYYEFGLLHAEPVP